MSTAIHDVRVKALALSLSERASLAHELILSLDEPSDFNLTPEQEAEIGRRVQMVHEGKARGRPAGNVFRDVRAKFGK